MFLARGRKQKVFGTPCAEGRQLSCLLGSKCARMHSINATATAGCTPPCLCSRLISDEELSARIEREQYRAQSRRLGNARNAKYSRRAMLPEFIVNPESRRKVLVSISRAITRRHARGGREGA